MVGRLRRFALNSDIKARIQPSPSLLMRMANVTYLTDVTTISVQITRDSDPSTGNAAGLSPARFNTVFRVYSGLVPISPHTTPRAVRLSKGSLREICGGSPFSASATCGRESYGAGGTLCPPEAMRSPHAIKSEREGFRVVVAFVAPCRPRRQFRLTVAILALTWMFCELRPGFWP